jgi:hypothetical protein
MEYEMKSISVYVLACLIVRKERFGSYEKWGKEIGLSAASLFRSVKDLRKAKLVTETVDGDVPNYQNAEKFLLYGFPFCFSAEKGKLVRGFKTGVDASSLKSEFAEGDYPAVWAHYEGDVKGFEVKPLHSCVPDQITDDLMDKNLYELLALLDVLRIGQAREVQAAQKKIKEILDRP